MKKRFICLLLSLLLCLSLAPLGALAEGDATADCTGGHDWSNKDGVCALCAAPCTHANDDGPKWNPDSSTCAICGKICDHSGNTNETDCENDTSCSVCGGLVPAAHKWADGVCSRCGTPCVHANSDGPCWVDGKCTLCGKVCGHKTVNDDGTAISAWADGRCTVCHIACSHRNADGASQWNVDTDTCAVCGMICLHETRLEDGVTCALCGKTLAAEPNPTPAPTPEPTPVPTAAPTPTPAPVHIHSYTSAVTAGDCTRPGTRVYTCKVCGEKRTESIPAPGHRYDDGTVSRAASCTEEGEWAYTCTVCGEKRTESIPALGHSYEIGIGSDDTVVGRCIRCGSQFTKSAQDISGQLQSSGTPEGTETGLYALPNGGKGLVIRQSESDENQSIRISSEQDDIQYFSFEQQDENGNTVQTLDLSSSTGAGEITLDITNGSDGGQIIDITKNGQRLEGESLTDGSSEGSRSVGIGLNDDGRGADSGSNIYGSSDTIGDDQLVIGDTLFVGGGASYGGTASGGAVYSSGSKADGDTESGEETSGSDIPGWESSWGYWVGEPLDVSGSGIYGSGIGSDIPGWNSSWGIGPIGGDEPNSDIRIDGAIQYDGGKDTSGGEQNSQPEETTDIPDGYTMEQMEELAATSGLSVSELLALLAQGATIVRMENGLFIQMPSVTSAATVSEPEEAEPEPTETPESTETQEPAESSEFTVEIVFGTGTISEPEPEATPAPTIQKFEDEGRVIVPFVDVTPAPTIQLFVDPTPTPVPPTPTPTPYIPEVEFNFDKDLWCVCESCGKKFKAYYVKDKVNGGSKRIIGHCEDCYFGSACVPSGTLITLSDGTQKPIESLTADDRFLVFDHETGGFTTAGANFIENKGDALYTIVNLAFSDGSTTRLISQHGYFDLDAMQYVYITPETYADFIGHRFYKAEIVDGDYVPSEATLVDAYVTEEYTGCWELVTQYHLNHYVDDFLSIPGFCEGFFNFFAYDEDLSYNVEDMAESIATYGLFDYENLADYITYEEFAAYPAQYLAVSIGKGAITPERIVELIEAYVYPYR